MKQRGLWKLPPEALKRCPDGWQVKSEPGFGKAMAVFMPLRRLGRNGWELALAPDASLPLTMVQDKDWTSVPREAAAGATHHLCLLLYDQSPERPGPSFPPQFDLQAMRQAQRKEHLGPMPGQPANTVSARELDEQLDDLRRAYGARLSRHVVSADGVDTAARGWAGAETLSLMFAFASCQYPAGMLDRPVAHATYRALAEYLDTEGVPLPERLLLLGDQVYTDATYGLLDPVRLDDRYRMPYEAFKDREIGPMAELTQEFLARLRLTPDDHEIADNWEPDDTEESRQQLELGMQAYWMHQRQSAPGIEPVRIRDQGPGWRLFMTDTRTRRCRRTAATLGVAKILGNGQTEELEAWLREGAASHPQDLQIVTSAAMLLPRSRELMDDPLHIDAWQGFPASLHRMLALLCDERIGNVVFLSGDAHLGCSATVTVRNLDTQAQTSFESHHAPALYAPYPFANESRWNLLLEDRFTFQVAGQGPTYECTVDARILEEGRQGCGLLRATRTPAGWALATSVLRPRVNP